DRPDVLAELVKSADTRQYAELLPKLLAHPGPAVALMEKELDQVAPDEDDDADRDALAKQQAQAAAALLQLGQPERLWPLFCQRKDPRVRTYLIHLLGPLGTAPHALARRLANEPDVSAQRALILCLGGFAEDRLGPDVRGPLTESLGRLYRDHPDPGLHGAA